MATVPPIYLLRNKQQLYLCIRGVVDIDHLVLRKQISENLKYLIDKSTKDNPVYLSPNILEAKTFDSEEEARDINELLSKFGCKIWKVQICKV